MKSLLYGVSCPLTANSSLIRANYLGMGAMQGERGSLCSLDTCSWCNFTAVTRQTVSGLLTAVPHPTSSPCFQRAHQQILFWVPDSLIVAIQGLRNCYIRWTWKYSSVKFFFDLKSNHRWAIIRLTRQSTLYITVFFTSHCLVGCLYFSFFTFHFLISLFLVL